MSDVLQAIRGMNDVLPAETPYWQQVESVCREVAAQYAYREIRFPLLEQTALFQRSIGSTTDIVEKEMYTFNDRNGDSLTLRPEGTAGCVRAGIEHGLLHNQIQRLWYMGPMFRHERPQKGRLRQFHQFGIEALGLAGPDIDVEIILIAKRILERLNLLTGVTLDINTLGCSEERRAYQQKLVDYFTAHQNKLDEDCQRRLTTNPLRILDSKNPDMQSLIANAPLLTDFIQGDSKKHFDHLCELLRSQHISFHINPRLVRGLDYYCLTAFEWVTTELGAQGSVCGGGRYDGLVEALGGKAAPAVGFSMGLERLVLLMQQKFSSSFSPDFYVIMDEAAESHVLALCEKIRTQFPALRIEMNAGFGKFATQLKRADKSGAAQALIVGENELRAQTVTVKNLKTTEQKTISEKDLFLLLGGLRHPAT
ncbi:MAG: histidine--tRNA ligase [Gammaproteobacteria bacterium RIFCSPHIGHO2_12_FULL_41_25]|nr:MAG: histidine--tRNA ligase [Gammaproteobacteria bacterium RIFCSPHIGHO2_02_FULL_42_43]OGT51904.1 MAG: histidine--tRNA ligase [Gammaproteobacteria bacterium RIFCSPHIGHO2_12_FULL_41_25]